MAITITPQIVTVNTTVEAAAKANGLQQQGAIVSCGGSTLTAGTSQYFPSLASAQAVIAAPVDLSSLSYATGEVTATVSGTLGLAVGQTFTTTIAGAVPATYNGTFTATVASTDTFTYPLSATPGTETSAGTYTVPGVSFLSNAVATFFAQGSSVGVSILELGEPTEWSASVTALQTYMAAQAPQPFYAYLVPPEFDAEDSAGLATLVGDYGSDSGQTYFFITAQQTNLSAYASAKSAFALVQNPGDSAVEAAAPFYDWLANSPGPANALAPMAYRFLFGVQPWNYTQNVTAINDALTASANVVLTGAEGGISNTVLRNGTLLSGDQASSWYGIDWFRITAAQQLAAAVINGSNTNPPLLYDQAGVNTLAAIAQSVASDAVAYGCVLSAVVSAVPFQQYVTANPTNYADGNYSGLSATLQTQNGFLTITFNVTALTSA